MTSEARNKIGIGRRWSVIMAVLTGLLAAMAPQSSEAVGRCQNWGQPSFLCPTTATRAVCGTPPNLYCLDDGGDPDADVCRGDTPEPRYQFDCATCTCQCDTANYPCAGCTAATSEVGQPCSEVNGGQTIDRCGTCGCGPGTALCVATNACVTTTECPAGQGFDPCAGTCVIGYVPPSPPTPEPSPEPSGVTAPASGRPSPAPTAQPAPVTPVPAAGKTPAHQTAAKVGLLLLAGLALGYFFGLQRGRLVERGVPFHAVVEKVTPEEDSLTVMVGHGRNKRRLQVKLRPDAELLAVTVPEDGSDQQLVRHTIELAVLRPHDAIEVLGVEKSLGRDGLVVKSLSLMTTDVTLARRQKR